MKTFEEVIESGMIDLQQIENNRQEQILLEKAQFKKGLMIAGGSVVVVSIFSIATGIFPLIIGVLIIALVVFLIWWQSVKKKYITSTKISVVEKVIKSIDESFVYQPTKFIPKATFKLSGFEKNYNSYTGEDYFYGIINSIPLEFSELTVQSKSKNSTVTVFRGTFMAIEFIRNFAGRTTVVPDKMEKALGSFGRVLQNLTFFRDALVKINHPDFEKNFAIYSTNEAEAQQILSGSLANYLLELQSKTERGIYFSVNGNKFYLGLFNNKDIFHVDIKTPINEATIRQYYEDTVFNINMAVNVFYYLEENLQNQYLN